MTLLLYRRQVREPKQGLGPDPQVGVRIGTEPAFARQDGVARGRMGMPASGMVTDKGAEGQKSSELREGCSPHSRKRAQDHFAGGLECRVKATTGS